jgi:hypothetical protein
MLGVGAERGSLALAQDLSLTRVGTTSIRLHL